MLTERLENRCVDVAENFRIIHPDGEFAEVRVLREGGYPMNAFIDDPELLAEIVQKYDGKGSIIASAHHIEVPEGGIMNPNGFNIAGAQSPCVKKVNVTEYRYFLIDIDPSRAEGFDHYNATDEEVLAAFDVGDKVMEFLKNEMGFVDPLVCFSGNGYHLLYPLDGAEVTGVNVGAFKKALNVLAKKFNTEGATIDTSVFDVVRNLRVYGTINPKLDTDDRPCRRSGILEVPDEIEFMDFEKVVKLSQLKPKSNSNKGKASGGTAGGKKKGKKDEEEEKKSLTEKAKEWFPTPETFVGEEDGLSRILVPDENGHVNIMTIKGQEFSNYLINRFWDEEDEFASEIGVKTVVRTYDAIANVRKVRKKIFKRLAKLENVIIYNFGDDEHLEIITRKGFWTVNRAFVKNHDFYFVDNFGKSQVLPVPTEESLYDLLKPYLNFSSEDVKLLIIQLCSWFVETIPRPIALFLGCAGSGKSSACRVIQDLLDPLNYNACLSMPATKEDMFLTMKDQYLVCFDNITNLSTAFSNALAIAVTGGASRKRTLYSTLDSTIVSVRSTIILNGITSVIGRNDLLSRTVHFETLNLQGRRKSETELNKKFEVDRPKILYKIFETLSLALKEIRTIPPDPDATRLADWEMWGRAIATVLYGDPEEFNRLYRANRGELMANALETNPLSWALMEYVKAHYKELPIYISPTDFLTELNRVANNLAISTSVEPDWPCSPNQINKKLDPVRDDLKNYGIKVTEVTRTGTYGRRRCISVVAGSRFEQEMTQLANPTSFDDMGDVFTMSE